MIENIYQSKNNYYFKNVRVELLNLIPPEKRNGTLLEVGAGDGSTLLFAKQNAYAQQIYGIELCQIKNSQQKNTEIDGFIIGNIEDIEIDFEEEKFDIIICPDVLEHLINPHQTIRKLKPFLKEDGLLIASIPNIRNWRIFMDIFVKGSFKYTAAGILDKTHLKFFCKKDMYRLFEDEGYSVLYSQGNLQGSKQKHEYLNRLTFRYFEEFITTQYFLITKKLQIPLST